MKCKTFEGGLWGTLRTLAKQVIVKDFPLEIGRAKPKKGEQISTKKINYFFLPSQTKNSAIKAEMQETRGIKLKLKPFLMTRPPKIAPNPFPMLNSLILKVEAKLGADFAEFTTFI